jgi:hypothetical protein
MASREVNRRSDDGFQSPDMRTASCCAPAFFQRRRSTAKSVWQRPWRCSSGLGTTPTPIRFKAAKISCRCVFNHVNERWLRRAAERLEHRIRTILMAALSPKAVDSALGITARERIHWYKAGRLPISNVQTIGHWRQQVPVPFFVFDEIEKLRSSPEANEGWRWDDGDTVDPPSVRPAFT